METEEFKKYQEEHEYIYMLAKNYLSETDYLIAKIKKIKDYILCVVLFIYRLIKDKQLTQIYLLL